MKIKNYINELKKKYENKQQSKIAKLKKDNKIYKDKIDELLSQMKDVMKQYHDQLKVDFLFAKLSVLENSDTYMIASDDSGKKILLEALKLSEKEGFLYTDRELSRKKIIVPAINEYLNKEII